MRLTARGVAKSFGATRALDGIDLDVEAGEVHAIVGENGAGKSTLMRIVCGAEQPDAGTIAIDGAPYRPRGTAEARARGVAMVHQERMLCPHLDVATNVALGIEPARLGFVARRELDARVDRALDRVFGGRAIDRRTAVGDLSPAEQQLVEIARALAQTEGGSGSRLLILDEPTSSLGADDVERLFSLVRGLEAGGASVLYISHFLDETMRIAASYTVLRDGRTVESGRVADATPDAIVRAMVGRRIEQLFVRTARAPGEVVLDVRDLAGARRPERASLELRRGEVLGVAGLIGAGRTELLRAIFGLDPVRRGAVRVRAIAGPASPARRLAQGVGFASEDRKGEGLATSMSIADNLTLSRLGPSGPALPRRQREAAARWIAELSIKCRGPDQRVVELSGGNQQKVALARLLHHDVDVLLLDEPTRGIDVASKAQIYALVDGLAARGKSVLLVSSYLPELFGVCDRIAVMCRGRLGEARPVGEWDEARVMREAVGS